MPNERRFHHGEETVQERLGEEAEAARNGRAISDALVRGASGLIARQPFVVLASVEAADRAGTPGATWASLVVGEPGFASVTDARTVEIDLGRAAMHPADPLVANIEGDPRLGMLFIEPGSRRRLRINGDVRLSGERIVVHVRETYPNCPQYIRPRRLTAAVDLQRRSERPAIDGVRLGADELALIRASDTFFVASANPGGLLDVSHRGGAPGFVEVSGSRLRIPDYPGNHMYNTLGNLVLNPRAGLVFIDFETGRTLLLTGHAAIDWNVPGEDERTGGTNRFWSFTVARWRSFELPVAFRWELLAESRHSPRRRAGAHDPSDPSAGSGT